MAEHTPGPWVNMPEPLWGELRSAETFELIAVMPELDDRTGDFEFIARACNAHDDLLAACEEMLDLLMCWHPGIAELNERVRSARTNAFDAIAKAKGD